MIGIERTMDTCRLIQSDALPQKLHGRFLVTNILLLLRSIYGSNETGVQALQDRLKEDALFNEYCRDNPLPEDEMAEKEK